MENLEQIRTAIELEVKHRYIDIRGKKQTFSSFIKNEALKMYKLTNKSPRWEIIAEIVAHYPCDSIQGRRRAIDRLITGIHSEIKT